MLPTIKTELYNPDTGQVRVTEDFILSFEGKIYNIRKGFITDGATVPKVFRGLVHRKTHDVFVPSVIHDDAYIHNRVPRDEADRVFREMLKLYGCPFWKRWTMWLVVRVCAGRYYGVKG